jgi:RTX calcium-binding nonapeptide repeat (4 copies)
LSQKVRGSPRCESASEPSTIGPSYSELDHELTTQETDTITLAAAGGFITVNRQATTLAADDNAKIIVNAGDGADTVDASALGTADYSALTVNGGNGDDLLTGGSDNDHLLGDGGNDRVIGFRGNDDLEGGDGNDVLVWNNGDNTDVMEAAPEQTRSRSMAPQPQATCSRPCRMPAACSSPAPTWCPSRSTSAPSG